MIPGDHFQDELAKEGIEFVDVYPVLRTGRIYEEPEPDIRTGEWKYRIEGHEPGGGWLCIVFKFLEEDSTFLITVWSVEHRRKR